MPTQMEFREIPIFRYFEAEAGKQLAAICTALPKKLGDAVLSFGQPVPGIHIVAEGELTVSAPNLDRPLAILARGQSVGEMALIEDSNVASAHVHVSSNEARLIFCSSEDFRKFLGGNPGAMLAFYRGASELLSSRLRTTDAMLNEQIDIGTNILAHIIKNSKVSTRLSEAQSHVRGTGEKLVGHLMDVMPLLEKIEALSPNARVEIQELRQQLETIFLVDAQDFDRQSQQLDLILQHFENLRRVATGVAPIPMRGDTSLFTFET